jgi:pimeloyl-ACP methyl ester carboxylesterase
MLHYQQRGQNTQQIIFVHGNSQSLEIWDKVIDAGSLSNQYSVISVDLPGNGKSFRSEQPINDYSIQGLASHLKDFIDQFSKHEYIVVGNSLSTNLLAEIVHLLFNCEGIFLTGASILGENINTSDIFKPNPNIATFFSAIPSDEDIHKLINDGSVNMTDTDKEKYKDIFRLADPAFREQLFNSISKQEWTDEIKNLNDSGLPFAIVYGENDHFTNVHYLDNIPMKKWRNKIISVPDAGHLIQDDQTVELAQLIKEFAEDCFK